MRGINQARDRSEVSALIDATLADRRSVTLHGPRGSGKSRIIDEAAHRLDAQRVPHVLVRHDDPDAASVLAAASSGSVHLVDGIDLAGPGLIAAVVGRMQQGGHGVVAHRVGARHREADAPLVAAIGQVADAQIQSVEVPPLTQQEIASLASAQLGRHAPSDALRIITSLSWGRPGWARDLVELWARGMLNETPFPTILDLQVVDAHLPEIARSASLSTRGLSAEHSVAAIALAGFGPQTYRGLEAMVGSQALFALTEHDLLAAAPGDPELFGVPSLSAAGLRLHADAGLLDDLRGRIAKLFAQQDSLGVPLDLDEALFCAQHLSPVSADTLPAAHTAPRLTSEVSSVYVAFGHEGIARELLRAPAAEASQLDALAQARLSTLLQGPMAGLHRLGRAPAQDADADTDTDTDADADADADAESLATHHLRACLRAEIEDWPTGSPGGESRATEVSSPEAWEHTVLELWNADDLTATQRALLAARTDTAPPEIALLADLLLDLDAIRHGAAEPPGSASDRFARLTAFALRSEAQNADLLSAAAVAEALLIFLSGAYVDAAADLRTIAEQLPAAPFHRLWVEHLLATAEALAAGGTARGADEWTKFMLRLPRFLPARLRSMVRIIDAELHEPGVTPAAQRGIPHHLLMYFSGRLDQVRAEDLLPRTSRGTIEGELAVARLARKHLEAARAQNPKALLSAAELLRGRGLWAPAVYALTEARNIYLRRRAAGSVAQCDAALASLERDARAHVAWFKVSRVAAVHTVRLTKRERDAALLAGDGYSNKEIADVLACSVRTAESHVANARAKLGAPTRHDLADRLRAIGLPRFD